MYASIQRKIAADDSYIFIAAAAFYYFEEFEGESEGESGVKKKRICRRRFWVHDVIKRRKVKC